MLQLLIILFSITPSQAQNTHNSFSMLKLVCTDKQDAGKTETIVADTENGFTHVTLQKPGQKREASPTAIIRENQLYLKSQNFWVEVTKSADDKVFTGWLWVNGRDQKDPDYILSPVTCSITEARSGTQEHKNPNAKPGNQGS